MNTVPNIGPFLRQRDGRGFQPRRSEQAMSRSYWVVGGEYTDTTFSKIAPGREERRYGPFATYDEARHEWAALSMMSVDNALVRYRIDRGGATRYWVVGGEYADTHFETVADGAEERRVGPFDSYEAARQEWQRLSMAWVDHALVRYRIEQN